MRAFYEGDVTFDNTDALLDEFSALPFETYDPSKGHSEANKEIFLNYLDGLLETVRAVKPQSEFIGTPQRTYMR